MENCRWREAEDCVLPLGMKLSPLREIEHIFFVNLYLGWLYLGSYEFNII